MGQGTRTSPPGRQGVLRRVSAIAAVGALVGSGLLGMTRGSAQDATPTTAADAPVEVRLIGTDGVEVGTATFTEGADGMVTIAVEAAGLSTGDHGIHVHAKGVCDPSGLEPFSTAGPHFNPTGGDHGGLGTPDAHAGDLNNVTADADGNVSAEITTDAFTLGDGPSTLFDEDGSAIVLHAKADDLETDPAGTTGARIACGVVAEPMTMAKPQASPIEGNAVITEPVPFTEDVLAQLQLPEGFQIDVYAQGLSNPRMMAVGPDGTTIYVTQPDAYAVRALRDTDGDQVIDEATVVAENLKYVHGIVFREDVVYLAGENTIWTADVAEDGTFSAPEAIVTDLPDGDQHFRHTLAIGPDDKLYISVGSSCNACLESNRENATILRMNLDGSDRETFASGLRNTLGWQWDPTTGLLWGMDMGSDWRGDDAPPEELNQIVEGGNYGWPWCYADQQVDQYLSNPPPGATRDAFCGNSVGSVLDYQAHSAPIGLVFIEAGDQFPAEWEGDALVAFRGSWNRDPATGYKVVRIDFEDGQPVGAEDLITGWLLPDGTSNVGRIAGLTLLPDGSLLISEDTNGVIYRVTYAGA